MLVLACLLWTGCDQGKTIERKVEVGYRGVARQNPLLAAERLLTEMKVRVLPVTNPSQIPFRDGAVVLALSSLLNHGDANTLYAWVCKGGHAMVFLTGAEEWIDDWSDHADQSWGLDKAYEEEEAKRFFELVGLKEVKTVPEATQQVEIRGRKFSVRLRDELVWEERPAKIDLQAGEALVSWKKGSGRITLVASARPFRNRYLGDLDHASLFHALVTRETGKQVCFLQGTPLSFASMLWEHAWMALVALVLLLVAWLWRSFRRFGPVLMPVDLTTRKFSDHLQMTGTFLWKHRLVRALLAPIQRDVREGLLRRGFKVEEDASCTELAGKVGLSPDRVRRAVFLVEPESELVFLRIIQDLQLLRTQL